MILEHVSAILAAQLSGRRHVQGMNMHELLLDMLSALSYTLRGCQHFILTLQNTQVTMSVKLMRPNIRRKESQEK